MDPYVDQKNAEDFQIVQLMDQLKGNVDKRGPVEETRQLQLRKLSVTTLS